MARRTTLLSILLLAPTLLAALTRPALVLGIACGGFWTLMNLLALSQMLSSWLAAGRSRWVLALWALIKFPVLYGAAVFALLQPAISPVGFGVGVTLVLAALACAGIMTASRPAVAPTTHGR